MAPWGAGCVGDGGGEGGRGGSASRAGLGGGFGAPSAELAQPLFFMKERNTKHAP